MMMAMTTTRPLLSIQLQTIPKSLKLFKVSAFSSPLPGLSPSTTRRRVLSLSVVSISLSSLSPASSTEFLELPDSGGVKALDLRGGTGSVPIDGDQVAIHYYGRLAAKQGWRFDSTYDHKDATGEPVPFVFILGSGKVIAGIEAAVRSMKVGGIRRVVIPPSQGYQNTTQEPLPPNFFDRQRLFTTIFNPTRDAIPRIQLPLPPAGPMTRARARKLQDMLSSIINKELTCEMTSEEATLREKIPPIVNLLTLSMCSDDPAQNGT